MKKLVVLFIIVLLSLFLFIRAVCGIFVIQPMGVIPGGVTIVYWRYNTNIPFITSADRILMDSGKIVSTHGKGEVLINLKPLLQSRALMKLHYSERLFLWSLHGKNE